jgi:hypothetical protein
MGGGNPSLQECGLGVPLLTLAVGDAGVVLSFEPAGNRLWMVDVKGDSAGAVPVHGTYQETRLSKKRILGGRAPSTATAVSVESEDGEIQGSIGNGVWLAAVTSSAGQVRFWDDHGRQIRALPFPASSTRPDISRPLLPGFLRRRTVARASLTYDASRPRG